MLETAGVRGSLQRLGLALGLALDYWCAGCQVDAVDAVDAAVEKSRGKTRGPGNRSFFRAACLTDDRARAGRVNFEKSRS